MDMNDKSVVSATGIAKEFQKDNFGILRKNYNLKETCKILNSK